MPSSAAHSAAIGGLACSAMYAYTNARMSQASASLASGSMAASSGVSATSCYRPLAIASRSVMQVLEARATRLPSSSTTSHSTSPTVPPRVTTPRPHLYTLAPLPTVPRGIPDTVSSRGRASRGEGGGEDAAGGQKCAAAQRRIVHGGGQGDRARHAGEQHEGVVAPGFFARA